MIAAELWRWLSASNMERSALIANRSELAVAIEFYSCDALDYDPAARGWWCDGIIELSISQLSKDAFRIVGAAYWAKSGHTQSLFHLAPFELEFYFHAIGDLKAKKTIFRFGSLDGSGDIKRERYDAFTARIIQNRPRRNSDWAIAIELSCSDSGRDDIPTGD